MSYPKVSVISSVNTAQMIEVDRRMIEDIAISLFQMMENAGLQLANVARDVFLGGHVAGKRVAVLAGAGGNGGGAIVAARRLTNWGAKCDVSLSRMGRKLADILQKQLNILGRIAHISLIEPEVLHAPHDLILDVLIGYSLTGVPEDRAAQFILAANSTRTPVLSPDVASGFDSSTGHASQICLEAKATLTIALPKTGMLRKNRSDKLGQILCADIGCPDQVFQSLGLSVPYKTPFSCGPVIELG